MSKNPELRRVDDEHMERIGHDAAFIVEMLLGYHTGYAIDVFVCAAVQLFLGVNPKPPLTRLDAWDKYSFAIRENIRLNIEQEATNGNEKQSG